MGVSSRLTASPDTGGGIRVQNDQVRCVHESLIFRFSVHLYVSLRFASHSKIHTFSSLYTSTTILSHSLAFSAILGYLLT